MKLRHRIQEWLADRVSFVQYPGVHRVVKKPKWRPFESSPFFQVEETSGKARLSWTAQLAVLFYSLILFAVGALILVVGGIVIWAIISSFF